MHLLLDVASTRALMNERYFSFQSNTLEEQLEQVTRKVQDLLSEVAKKDKLIEQQASEVTNVLLHLKS